MKSLITAPKKVPLKLADTVPQNARQEVFGSSPYLLRLASLLDVLPGGEDAEEQVELCLAALETAVASSARAPTRPAGLPVELDVAAEEGWLADGESVSSASTPVPVPSQTAADSSAESKGGSDQIGEGDAASNKRKRGDGEA